jgi:hypothetical protein
MAKNASAERHWTQRTAACNVVHILLHNGLRGPIVRDSVRRASSVAQA